MEMAHRNVIRNNWLYLLDTLTISTGVSDYLFQERVFSQDILDEIDSKPTRKQKVTEFFNFLVRRGPDAFDKFLKALHNTQQEFIAQKLLQDLDVLQCDVAKAELC